MLSFFGFFFFWDGVRATGGEVEARSAKESIGASTAAAFDRGCEGGRASKQTKRERQKECVSDLDSSHDTRARQEASTTRVVVVVVDHTNARSLPIGMPRGWDLGHKEGDCLFSTSRETSVGLGRRVVGLSGMGRATRARTHLRGYFSELRRRRGDDALRRTASASADARSRRGRRCASLPRTHPHSHGTNDAGWHGTYLLPARHDPSAGFPPSSVLG